ncbi:MAG TPA: addiction module protein [Candidatus Kapabacteria bacterium]|nr:addiction module protein [Candidatus Kapabacteria bacterium]
MDRDLRSITEEALALDTESRAALMDTLAASIEQEHEFLDEKLDELERRWKSIETGEAKTVSIDEAVTNARRRIAH